MRWLLRRAGPERVRQAASASRRMPLRMRGRNAIAPSLRQKSEKVPTFVHCDDSGVRSVRPLDRRSCGASNHGWIEPGTPRAPFSGRLVQHVALMRLVAGLLLRLRIGQLEVEAYLRQDDLRMIHGMGADRRSKPVMVRDRRDLGGFATAPRPSRVACALRTGKPRVDEALAFVDVAAVHQFVGQRGQGVAGHFLLATFPQIAVHGPLFRAALGVHLEGMRRCGTAFRIRSVASRACRVGSGERSRRPSGLFSSGSGSSIPWHGSSVKGSAKARPRSRFPAREHFEVLGR